MNVRVLDYGVGNLHSLTKALTRLGARVSVADADLALPAGGPVPDALVLPGVGAFDAAATGFGDAAEPLRQALLAGLPCLGICLGMQLLFEGSDEGDAAGLRLFGGRVRRLRARRVPHMGWNSVSAASPEPAVAALAGEPVYFAHSFVAEPADLGVVAGWSVLEDERIPAVVRAHRTWGVQFHPEKSGAAGLRLLAAFLEAASAPPRQGSSGESVRTTGRLPAGGEAPP